jgi:hypothetical protein
MNFEWLQAAREGIILLKNTNNILPLDGNRLRKVTLYDR